MVNILDITKYNPAFDKHIIWQYDNAKCLKSLIAAKKEWFNTNVKQFWADIVTNFLDISTANDWGLLLWGKILQEKRQYLINGILTNLSTALYRRVIKAKLNLLFSAGTVPDILNFVNFIFADYSTTELPAVTVRDNLDMTITYVFNFQPTAEEDALIQDDKFLPRPAGVLANRMIIPNLQIFGFEGTGLQTWNNGTFWNGQIF